MGWYNLHSAAGIAVFLGIAWLLSENRQRFPWRVAAVGVVFLLAFGLFLFAVPAGQTFFRAVNDFVFKVLGSAQSGVEFVFGRLAVGPGQKGAHGEESLGFILITQALPTIIFFSALMSLLYYIGLMPLLIRFFARCFSHGLRLSGAESLCAASDIFVGIEASLTIRPHLATMTRSELCTVLTTGMASVASNVLVLYVKLLGGQFPTIAGHLVSASFLTIPAALIMAKVLVPETETPVTLGKKLHAAYERESNVFEAVINGSMAGVKLIAGIVALLIAVLGLVALLDLALGATGTSLAEVLGYVFRPFVALMGVPWEDVPVVAKIIGERLVLTEVTSYIDLDAAMKSGALLHPRSAFITAYALCGFAHLASMAIFVGGIAALAPERKTTLAKLGFRALLAATLATLLVGCIAGACYTGPSLLFGAR